MTWGVEDASVAFGSRPALHNVTLLVEPSTVSIVVGGDGAGKTTLLRAIVGLVRLSGGVTRRPEKKEIGYIPATAGLYVDLTVDENVRFFAGAYGLRGGELTKRAAEMLERIGLAGARSRLAGQLSGGMQRKLAVGMAMLHRPPMLVLDEPTTGVDPVSRAELWRLISAAAAEGGAVVVATTYVGEAYRASTVVLLEHGRSIAVGSPSEIIASVPGTLGVVEAKEQPPGLSWRWGATWRVWAPSMEPPAGARLLQPDLQDAVMIAALADEQKRREP